jgi:hypothetical protein
MTHHIFPDDKKTIVILCANHHLLIDHEKEGFIKGKSTRPKKKGAGNPTPLNGRILKTGDQKNKLF